jgi:hypothetical protein
MLANPSFRAIIVTHPHTRSDGDNRNHGIPNLGYGPDVPHTHVLQLARSRMTEPE